MNSLIQLGRLEEVDIKEIWRHEQYDFSTWLSLDENIELLNDTIGLTLTDINSEVYVGSYRCDIFAKDETTGMKIIIENQLDSTDHDHLGKIITYASGLNAEVIIWIVREAREEHRSAIEWLNNNTIKGLSFFLIEIHAFKIGNYLPAPKLVVVEKPNDFVKSSKEEELSKSQSERLFFWNEFNSYVNENGKPFNTVSATTDHWYNIAIGTSDAKIQLTLVNKYNNIGVSFYINDKKEIFDFMFSNKDTIEEKLGFNLEWQRLDNKKASQAIYYISGLDFDDKSNYDVLLSETFEKAFIMREVFKEYMRIYNTIGYKENI